MIASSSSLRQLRQLRQFPRKSYRKKSLRNFLENYRKYRNCRVHHGRKPAPEEKAGGMLGRGPRLAACRRLELAHVH